MTVEKFLRWVYQEQKCAVITRELVGVSRSDASIAPTGVGGCLEAWITCGNKIPVNNRCVDVLPPHSKAWHSLGHAGGGYSTPVVWIVFTRKELSSAHYTEMCIVYTTHRHLDNRAQNNIQTCNDNNVINYEHPKIQQLIHYCWIVSVHVVAYPLICSV